jgi:hypothetical protein
MYTNFRTNLKADKAPSPVNHGITRINYECLLNIIDTCNHLDTNLESLNQ